LPGFFLRFASIAGTFLHGSCATAVFYFAAFSVIHTLAETALVGFFINLRAAYLFSAAHYIDRGFLATHQLTDNLIDKAILDDPAIYPDEATLKNLFTVLPYDPKTQRNVTRLWTKIVTGQ